MGLERPGYAYRHPGKTPSTDPSDPAARSIRSRPDVRPDDTGDATIAGKPLPLASTSLAVPARQAKRRGIDITFAVPSHGGLRIFGEMTAAGIARETAILSLGTRALKAYETAGSAVDHVELLERFGDVAFQHPTRRMIGIETLNRARGTLDPYGVMSAKELGRLIGRIAIQHWIETGPDLVS